MATVTAPVWLLAMLAVLAACGFCGVFAVAAGWAERAWDWLAGRRPWVSWKLWDLRVRWKYCGDYGPGCEHEDKELSGLCDGCWNDGEHCDGQLEGCDCTCAWPEDWAERELPPERTWEQMTSHQFPLESDAADHFLRPPGYLTAERERRAPWWEAEHRAAYESLGFEYPSGLMARVRELTP